MPAVTAVQSLTFPPRPVCLKIAVVSQDCVLFARSVRENIKYGYEDASDEDMYEAARLASAHEFITELSKGYDTGSTHRHPERYLIFFYLF